MFLDCGATRRRLTRLQLERRQIILHLAADRRAYIQDPIWFTAENPAACDEPLQSPRFQKTREEEPEEEEEEKEEEERERKKFKKILPFFFFLILIFIVLTF